MEIFHKHKTPINTALIILMLAIFALEVYLGGQGNLTEFFNNFGFSLDAVKEGKVWIFVTSLFLHADPQHIVLNLIALFFFGRAIEEELGWRKYILIFFLSGIVGNIGILFLSLIGIMPAAIPTIGASGAIFGLMGAAMLVKPLEFVFYPYLIPIPLIIVAILYTIYNVTAFIVVLAGSGTNIAYVSHLGGLAAGILYGLKQVGAKKGLLMILIIILLLVSLPALFVVLSHLEFTNYIGAISNIFK